MDADFLVFYRVDLRDPATRISAEAFFARLFRLFHYRGAIRDRLQAEQEEEHQPTRHSAAQHEPAPPAQVDRSGTRWVSPEEMRTLFPDLF